jgi:ACS family tartrate transporter-like MFS transporter
VGATAFRDQTALLVPCLCLAIAGITTFVTGLWSLITSRVRGRGGAVAVGLINSTGSLGGFAGPYALGYLKDATGSYTAGLICLIVAATVAGALVLCVNQKRLGEVR